MSDDNDQDRGEGQPATLPQADGPLVDVALPDGQRLFAVVKSRRREPDGTWWYDLQIHLPKQGSEHGRLLALPAAVDFRAPAEVCEPIRGQAYDTVPTERPGVVQPPRRSARSSRSAKCSTRPPNPGRGTRSGCVQRAGIASSP